MKIESLGKSKSIINLIIFLLITIIATCLQILVPYITEQLDWRISYRALFIGVLIFQVLGVVILIAIRSPVWIFGSFFLIWFLTGFIPFPPTIYFLGFITASAVLYVLQTIIPSLREGRDWLRLGKFDKQSIILTLITIVIAAIALLIWHKFTQPDLSRIITHIPNWSPIGMVLALMGFSIFNALGEELAFRGIYYAGLSKVIQKPIIVIIIQAILFGMIHLKGFPSGVSGMILAGIYGIALGLIRWKSNGILAPFIAHILADLVIGLIVMRVAGLI